MWQSLQTVTFTLDNAQLEYSVLNPNGPFVRLNPFSKLCSGETQTLVLSFSPRESILVSAAPRQCCCPGILTLQDHSVATIMWVGRGVEGVEAGGTGQKYPMLSEPNDQLRPESSLSS